jgi:hypothetical protein
MPADVRRPDRVETIVKVLKTRELASLDIRQCQGARQVVYSWRTTVQVPLFLPRSVDDCESCLE